MPPGVRLPSTTPDRSRARLIARHAARDRAVQRAFLEAPRSAVAICCRPLVFLVFRAALGKGRLGPESWRTNPPAGEQQAWDQCSYLNES